MHNKSFGIVIVDTTGRPVRRYRVTTHSLRVASAVAVGLFALVTGIGLHGAVRYAPAKQAELLSRENVELRALITELEDRFPEAQQQAEQASRSFAQLWAKSGLGVEEKLLSVGPVESGSTEPATVPVASDYDARLLDLRASELSLEFDRIRSTGLRLQRTLAETQEYFHDAERLLSNTPSIRPARTAWFTSQYGKRRDPMHGHWVMHKGIDLGGFIGMPVVTPADGVVIWTGRRGGYGKTVVVDHGFGIQTHFAHLSRFTVETGQRVSRGDIIAEMGSTGKSTGPHLHYEVRRAGHPLDPTKFILD